MVEDQRGGEQTEKEGLLTLLGRERGPGSSGGSSEQEG